MRQINILLAIALSLMHWSPNCLAQQNGNYYHLVLEEVSWDEAVEICLERGGNLATVTTKPSGIKSSSNSATASTASIVAWWTADPNDNESNPQKTKVDMGNRRTWDYSRWRRLEPDGNFGGKIDSSSTVVIPQRGADHKWNDHPNKAVELAFSKYEIKGYIGEFGWASVSGNLHYVGTNGKNLPPCQLAVLLRDDGHKMYSIPGSPDHSNALHAE